jgi:Flp pilus assembly protein TadG
MRNILKRLWADESGANVIEFAIALPTLTIFIYGIFVIGKLFEANAGMQHALGEAARYATLFPTPTDDELKAKMAAKKFGTGNNGGTLSPLGISTAGNTKTLTLTYSQPTNFLLFKGPNVSISRSKKVYLAAPNPA